MRSKGWRHTAPNRCWPGCRLDMSENALRQLPPGLCHCQHLIELNLAENMLTYAAFPKEFTKLTRLTCTCHSHANSHPLSSQTEMIAFDLYFL
jgi:hypothetical protein